MSTATLGTVTHAQGKPLYPISAKQLTQFREEGYLITEPAFDSKTLADAIKEFTRLQKAAIADAEKTGDAKHIALAKLRPFIGEAHKQSDLLKEFVKAPAYLEACRVLLGPDCDLYYNQAVIKPPEKGLSFGWHQDNGYGTVVPMEYLTCWTAVGRSYIENGCIWIIPGSHKRGLLKHVKNELSTDAVVDDETGAIPVELEPGQIVIFNSLLLHKSGPNVSKDYRYAYVPQYHVAHVVDGEGKPTGDRFPVLRNAARVG